MPVLERTARYLVVLETMWSDTSGVAPRWFPINAYNHSGRRLYKLTDSAYPSVWVTNACPQRTTHARLHGTPSPRWLYDSLTGLPAGARRLPLLICGAVARDTYKASGYAHRGPVLFMLHPAARTWTKTALRRATNRVARATLL
jgi:hypothetical protein